MKFPRPFPRLPGWRLAGWRLAGRRREAAAPQQPAASSLAFKASRHPGLAEAQALAARLPALLVAADRVASTVAQGVHGRRRAGMGDSFWQYRQALPGEAASRIDWRQSARSSRAYVRETEWEAAQTVYLWLDPSPSMRWRSGNGLPLKSERAELLLLALASLLLRGGEHVRLLGGAGAPVSGQTGLARLAAQMALQAELPDAADAGLPPAILEMPRHARLVMFGDMLAEPSAIEALFARLSAMPVGCTVVQILDPAELTLPYEGRIRFEGLEGEAAILTSRAQDLGEAYAAAMSGHQEHLASLCARAGFGLTRHRTDQPAATALLAVHQALHQARNPLARGLASKEA